MMNWARLRALYCALIALLVMQTDQFGSLCASNKGRTARAA
jgi:hypothetical protein